MMCSRDYVNDWIESGQMDVDVYDVLQLEVAAENKAVENQSHVNSMMMKLILMVFDRLIDRNYLKRSKH